MARLCSCRECEDTAKLWDIEFTLVNLHPSLHINNTGYGPQWSAWVSALSSLPNPDDILNGGNK
jgi:hypothetical protein